MLLECFKPAASTAAGFVNVVAGASLGAAFQDLVEAPPTLTVFNQTAFAACLAIDSGHPNMLVCNNVSLAQLNTLFPQYNTPTLAGGCAIVALGTIIGFVGSYYHRMVEQASSPSEIRKRKFIEHTAPTFRDILYSFGGVLVGNSLQAIANQGLSPLQQILNAICVPINNTTQLCDMDELKSVVTLLAQPSITMIVVGALLLAMLGVCSIINACCCATPIYREDAEGLYQKDAV